MSTTAREVSERLRKVSTAAKISSMGLNKFFAEQMAPYRHTYAFLNTYSEDIPGFSDLTVTDLLKILSEEKNRAGQWQELY